MHRSETLLTADKLTISMRTAEPAGGDGSVRYMWSEHDETELNPAWVKLGFNDTFDKLDTKLALSREFAHHGINAVMIDTADQSGRQPLSIGGHARHALYSLEAIGLHEQSVPTAGYCIGGQVVAKTVALATDRDIGCFKEAPIALVSSTGLDFKETPWAFFYRGLIESRQPQQPTVTMRYDQEAVDNATDDLMWAVLRNPVRSLVQYWGMTTGRIDLDLLASQAGSVADISFKDDRLVPSARQSVIQAQYSYAVTVPGESITRTGNVASWVPYSWAPGPDRQPLGVRGQIHVDPLNRPDRLVGSLAPFLLGTSHIPTQVSA